MRADPGQGSKPDNPPHFHAFRVRLFCGKDEPVLKIAFETGTAGHTGGEPGPPARIHPALLEERIPLVILLVRVCQPSPFIYWHGCCWTASPGGCSMFSHPHAEKTGWRGGSAQPNSASSPAPRSFPQQVGLCPPTNS